MSFRDLLLGLGGAGVGWWIIRSVMEPGIDLLEEGRKALSRGTDGARPPARIPPGPRPGPGVTRVQPSSRKTAATTTRPGAAAAASAARAAKSARPHDVSLHDWFLILDVPPSAGRREIQEAARLRLARARSAGDSAAAAQILRAAASGLGQRRSQRDPG